MERVLGQSDVGAPLRALSGFSESSGTEGQEGRLAGPPPWGIYLCLSHSLCAGVRKGT